MATDTLNNRTADDGMQAAVRQFVQEKFACNNAVMAHGDNNHFMEASWFLNAARTSSNRKARELRLVDAARACKEEYSAVVRQAPLRPSTDLLESTKPKRYERLFLLADDISIELEGSTSPESKKATAILRFITRRTAAMVLAYEKKSRETAAALATEILRTATYGRQAYEPVEETMEQSNKIPPRACN